MKNLQVGVVAVAALVASGKLAQAQVFLKPSSSKAIPLRVGSLKADVQIIGGLAVTNWTMTAQIEPSAGGFSENYEGTVCDFICARPTDSKVVAFQANNLNARVVERAFALPRVTFATAKDDPLRRSGLTEANSFRATIYPVAPWNELTLSGTWVQPLRSTPTGASFRLPLLALKGATMRLPELSARVSVQGAEWKSLLNSYELPVQNQSGKRVFSLAQKNFRVLRDLTVTLSSAPVPSLSEMLISSDGHFAVALRSRRSLRAARVEGPNIETSSSSRIGNFQLVTGTFRGQPNELKARFSAQGLNRALSLVPVPNDAASALWATQKINALSAVKGNRAQIIALSKEFSVASPFTSWLSVGDEDLRIYRRALVSTQLDPLVREYWLRVASGQNKSARVNRLRRVIAQISAGNKLDFQTELDARLGSAVNYAASVGWIYSGEPKTAAQRRFLRLQKIQEQRFAALGIKNSGEGQPYYNTREQLQDLREKIRVELRKPHPDYAQLETLNARFSRVYGLSEPDPRLRLFGALVQAQNIELQTRAAQVASDQKRLAKLEEERQQNSNNLYFTNNIGDPPIYVQATESAREVVAVMPDGKVKTLEYNVLQKRWEGNYDVPVGTRDGDYSIQIIIVSANGQRERRVMPFRVDTHAPSGKGRVLLSPGGSAVRLEVEGSGDVAFVQALLPWGEKVSLLPSTREGNGFFALAHVPKGFTPGNIKVTFILIDGAHNTSSVEAVSSL